MTFLHHKRAVSAITDIEHPSEIIEIDLWQDRGVPVTKTPLEAAPAPLVGAL